MRRKFASSLKEDTPMRVMLCEALVVLLISEAAVKAAGPPKEIQDKVKALEESVQKAEGYSAEFKKAIAAGAGFYGKPSFIGCTDISIVGVGSGGYLQFGLFNPNEKPACRVYHIRSTTPGGQSLMKTVLFAFEHKAQWVAVYPRSDDPNRPLYVAVYP